ncbi:hypothetical protein DMA11_16165 [Marinilabiliaceae bacterium JC017]|nr:hypothetical protein DMA11_16165 [Marinilabiliaceae bacterium JC017]
MAQKEITNQLLSAKKLIGNSWSDSAVKAAVAVFSYPEERISEGIQILADAETLTNKYNVEQAEQYEATHELNTKRTACHQCYMGYLKIARTVFSSPLATNSLQLNGTRKQALGEWLKQVKAFYENLLANADLMAEGIQYGLTQERMERGLNQTLEVEQLYLAQIKEIGEAQDAREKRDAKLDELQEWTSRYQAVAEVALADSPQLLEKLGILVRSDN